ncbi:hypothetical protein JYN54_09705 [Salmonella enterica subsp. enterica serovar Muenchen]|nr:hypothetical protein [Salmonella enterica]EAX3308007.1 hypothetical protein [Salmonella enterica]ECI0956657.1 hypothetical protein [Salmonella enterica subsp. enterica serovar Muenchen]QVD01115.1 hypothetical protein JYN54_09705 [Salmonella enterica subsp. enterica serovar Muenchen]
MLSGKELGLAIEQAINKKLALGTARTKAEIARHFEIKPPSIHDWIKKGSISKDKLPELWRYFSDVVGPEHWGLEDFPNQETMKLTKNFNAESGRVSDAYQSATEERRIIIDYLLSLGDAVPGWVDSDVRAYVSTMDEKARKWLQSNKSSYKSKAS